MLNGWMRVWAAGMVASLAILLAACNGGEPDNGKPKVIATIFPYYDIVRAVGGDKINAEMLLDPNAEVHDYQASPADRDRIESAKLVVKNGLGLDDWSVLKGSKAEVLVIGDGVGTALGAAEAPATAPGVVNPHVWLDPIKQIKATELVRDALIKMDPANKATYDANAEKYIAELKKLDADFAAATKGFSKKSFIGFHEAYAYLAARYGLDQVASLEASDKSGLTPDQVDYVIGLIKSGKATVLFSEDQASKEKVDKIVKQTGAVTGVLLPLETCGDRSQTYVGMMRQNLATLQATMK